MQTSEKYLEICYREALKGGANEAKGEKDLVDSGIAKRNAGVLPLSDSKNFGRTVEIPPWTKAKGHRRDS